MFVVRRERPRGSEVVQPEMAVVFRTMMPTPQSESAGAKRETARWRPPIEVYETVDALVVVAEIAAIDDESLAVTVDDGVLVIRGERSAKCGPERRSYHEARIPYGAFGAEIAIPFPVDAAATEAAYQDGLLRIVLPRSVARTIVPRRSASGDGREEGAR